MFLNLKSIKKLIIVSLISVFALTSCGSENTANSNKENGLEVYTSFSAITSLTKPIILDGGSITQLTEANVEAHDFEPSGRDVARITESDLFIYNGLGFEHYVEDLISSVEGETVFVDTSENVPYVLEDDAHIWLSFLHVKTQVKNITNGLVSVDNANADAYIKNEERFLNEIEGLESEYASFLNSKKGQSVVVLHPSYNYLFEEYEIKQIPIQINHEVEPTIAELKSVIDYINTNSVKYIITPSSEITKPLQTVLDETSAEVVVVNNLENLTGDITKDTYIDIMSENLNIIKTVFN